MKKILLKAIGCKVSQHDALAAKEFLEEHGHQFITDIQEADCAIVQTCTVTQKSDSEARQFIRHISRINPEIKVIVTGCYAERAPRELAAINAFRIIGNLDPNKWQKLLEAVQEQAGTEQDIYLLPHESFAQSTLTFDKARPYLKIYEGCDHNCSYCIVPSVRGKGRSFTIKMIILQLHKLIQCGYKEIIITGVNLASYGKDINLSDGLYQLAQEIEKIDAEFRVRFSSVEPSITMKKFFEFICSSKKIVPHFHLPIQHSCQKILNTMHRPYHLEEFTAIINSIYHARKDACIGSDIITGFPTETDTEFRECFDYIAASRLSYLHVFHFSPRPGTDAYSMRSASTDHAIKERSFLLRKLSNTKFTQFKNSLLDSELTILTFRYNKDNMLNGLSENYIHTLVQHSNCSIPENSLIRARLSVCNNEFIAIPL